MFVFRYSIKNKLKVIHKDENKCEIILFLYAIYFVHIYLASSRSQILYQELGRVENMISVSLKSVPWLGEADV